MWPGPEQELEAGAGQKQVCIPEDREQGSEPGRGPGGPEVGGGVKEGSYLPAEKDAGTPRGLLS